MKNDNLNLIEVIVWLIVILAVIAKLTLYFDLIEFLNSH